ncbi:LysR family transcriptional regulator [Nocardia sp. NPDC051787]|uniref:LysR family transcriptional regulator n=1 Tax=Nocardia sp. NPDC051787 TaxID=3155415 RepID=UPI0034426C22
MELRQLRYFLAVAEERNLTRAAETLGIRPTSLSQQIIALERHLDTRLFVRTSAGMTPTPAGERLFDRARAVVAEARRAEESVRGGRTLRLAVTPGVSPDVVAMLWQVAGTHAVDIADMQTAQQVTGLRGGVLDAGLLLLPVDSPDLDCVTVADAELGVVAAVGHRLARQDSVRWPDLDGSALLWFARASAPGYHDAVRDAWTRAGWRPAVVREGAPRRVLFEAELRHGGDVIGLRPAWDVPVGAGLAWLPFAEGAPRIRHALAWNAGDFRAARFRAWADDLAYALVPHTRPELPRGQRAAASAVLDTGRAASR